ncbi:MAG: efflux RND transporter periplasmic adaptor subunit [Pseudomonadota bacterium]
MIIRLLASVSVCLFLTPLGAANAQNVDLLDTDSTARGVITPMFRAEIGTEIVAAIESIPFREGERFSKGDTLMAFACGKYEAEGRSAEAVLEARRTEHKSKKFLRERKAVGQLEVDIAAAQLREAQAKREAIQVQIDQCSIAAPFHGRVIEIFRQAYEFTRANEPLMAIVDDKSLEIDLIVPSTWLQWLRPGSPFTFTIDETGAKTSASITRIGAEVDPVSQTIKVTGLFTATPQNTLPGMSGTAQFDG